MPRDFASFFAFNHLTFTSFCAIVRTMATYMRNKKATFDFELKKTFEAGLVLHGFEVKAIRKGMGNITSAYVVVRGGEAYLIGATINPYQPANTPKSYDPERPRKLLLSEKELAEIEQAVEKERLTAVAVSLYSNAGKIKLEVAIARGKRQYDKRQTLKERDSKRDINRTLKNTY